MIEDRIVALTGAGISAESGVPTFRGQGGLWEGFRAQDLATPQAFKKDPGLVWAFYHYRRRLVAGCRPNPAHEALALLEESIGSRFTLITQNVDGLHKDAGQQNIIEIHGSLWELKCTACSQIWQDREIYPDPAMPTCPGCGQIVRPAVVWFGESLDPMRLLSAWQAVEQATIMLVIGTSGVVFPAAQMPELARQHGALVVEFNPEETPLSSLADEVYREAAAQSVPGWCRNYLEG